MPYGLVQRTRGRNSIKYDPQEIQGYAVALESRADHKQRFIIHDEDQGIFMLEKYTLEEIAAKPSVNPADWPGYTSNDPRAFWNVIRRAATSNKPRFRIKLPAVDTPQQALNWKPQVDDRSIHERFAMGLWDEIDDERSKKAKQPFQYDLAFQAAIRGGMAVRCWFEPSARNPFRAEIWDLRTTCWEVGADGLSCVVHHYKEDYAALYARYADTPQAEDLHPDELGMVDCYDIWWLEEGKKEPEVWNAYIANGTALIEPTQHKELDHIPVVIVPTFTPTIEWSTTTSWQTPGFEWESIYTTNKEMYKWINRIGTLYGIYLRQHAIGPYISTIKGLPAGELEGALRPFKVINAPQGGDIKPVAPPEMAGETKEFLAQLQAAAQRGSVPYSIFGQTQFQLSGFAINQLQGAVSIVASQVTNQMGTVYRLCTDEFIQQYKKRGSKITIKGFDQRQRGFIMEIQKSQIREKYNMIVTIEPELPIDKLQEAQIAAQWAAVGVSKPTIFDEVLKLDDPFDEAGRSMAEAIVDARNQVFQQQQIQNIENPSPQVLPPEAAGILGQHVNPSQQFQFPGHQHNPENDVPLALPQNAPPFIQ